MMGTLDQRSIDLRKQVVNTLRCAGRGHIGSTMSLLEIVRVLYDDILRHDPANPKMEDRDRFILSKGHGCLAQYVLLADKGYFPARELELFCRGNGILGGHPERGKVPGVEASTGSLGHGLPIALGMALAARIRGLKHRVFVVAGDGEINEGSVWEAALSAGKHGVENLILLVDYNKIQSYGPVEHVQPLEPLADKWRAFGFGVTEVDGHDVPALRQTLANVPLESGKPSCVICHTVKGKGVDYIEGDPSWHHKSKFSEEHACDMLKALEAC